MTTFDLTLLALAPVVLVLLTYPLLSDRASRRAGPDVTGDHADLVQPAAPTRAPPKLTGLPVRDLPEALRRSGGSQDIADSLLEQMLAELPSQTEDLATAVVASDWPAARGLVHDIRCETALCAVPALHAAVCRLQAAARDEDPGAVAGALAEVDRERRRLLAFDWHAPADSPLAEANAS